jgi:folate-binding protein YgfZ
VALSDASLTLWRGTDVLSFIDGLSTNRVAELSKGQLIRTVFTDTNAKIIDCLTLFHMGDFIVAAGYLPVLDKLLNHSSKKILGQDVEITDISQRNDLFIEFDCENSSNEIGSFSSQGEITRGNITNNYSILVTSKGNGPPSSDDFTEFNQWRIANKIPWNGYEITNSFHPFACGLEELVHQQKGCYIGQEILARMRSRGRQGKVLSQVETISCKPANITTKGDIQSLAIIRT